HHSDIRVHSLGVDGDFEVCQIVVRSAYDGSRSSDPCFNEKLVATCIPQDDGDVLCANELEKNAVRFALDGDHGELQFLERFDDPIAHMTQTANHNMIGHPTNHDGYPKFATLLGIEQRRTDLRNAFGDENGTYNRCDPKQDSRNRGAWQSCRRLKEHLHV